MIQPIDLPGILKPTRLFFNIFSLIPNTLPPFWLESTGTGPMILTWHANWRDIILIRTYSRSAHLELESKRVHTNPQTHTSIPSLYRTVTKLIISSLGNRLLYTVDASTRNDWRTCRRNVAEHRRRLEDKPCETTFKSIISRPVFNGIFLLLIMLSTLQVSPELGFKKNLHGKNL